MEKCKRSYSGEHSFVPVGGLTTAKKMRCVLCGYTKKTKEAK